MHMDTNLTQQKVNIAIKLINRGKWPELDEIPVKLLYFDVGNVAMTLYECIAHSWEGAPIPQNLMYGMIVSIQRERI